MDSELWCPQFQILHIPPYLNIKVFFYCNLDNEMVILLLVHCSKTKWLWCTLLSPFKEILIFQAHVPVLFSAIKCCPFRENYSKLYFNKKHFEKGLNRWGWNVWDRFLKKGLFWPISNATLNCAVFLHYHHRVPSVVSLQVMMIKHF